MTPRCRGRDVRDEPLLIRRRAVDTTLGDRHMLLFAARRLAADRLEAWADVERRGLEGLVAKNEASAYGGAERSSLWLKVKRRQEGQFVWSAAELPQLGVPMVGAASPASG